MSNTILLMADQHNPLVSSVYGHPFALTPHMERLARRGTVYAHAYCPSPLCMPSRSAFLSGRRVHELQAYSNCTLLVWPDVPTYGAVLKEQGVYTAYIGKTDAYDKGDRLGFSETMQLRDRKPIGDIHFNRRPLAIRSGAENRANAFGIKDDAFDKDLQVADAALQWLRERAPTLKQPWCLTVNLVNPHPPHWNTREFWDLYPEGGDLPAFDGRHQSALHPHARDLRDHFGTDRYTGEQIRGLRRGYLGNVTFVDRQLGRLLDALDELGLTDTTNLIYTADHGEMLGKFGVWGKCSMYEDSVRVPCIGAGPDFATGGNVRTPVDLHDVQAAIFRAAGAIRPEEWAGTPLQAIPEDDPNRVVFSEYHGHGTRSGAYAIRKGDWKLVFCMEAPHQLFHLADDPNELNNVYAAFPGKAHEMELELRGICSPEAENERAHLFQDRQLQALCAMDKN